jgi:hypothetical protein
MIRSASEAEGHWFESSRARQIHAGLFRGQAAFARLLLPEYPLRRRAFRGCLRLRQSLR